MPLLSGAQDQSTSERIRLLAVDHLRDALVQLQEDTESADQTTHVVACIWSKLPDLSRLLDDVVQRMGETAQRLWPHWYGVTLPRSHNIDDLLAAVSRSSSIDAGSTLALMPPWLQAAAARCEARRPPLPKGFSKAVHLRQLAAALAPSELEFLLCADSPTPASNSLHGFARAAEWIAQETRRKVSVLVPRHLADAPELDCISCFTPVPRVDRPAPSPPEHVDHAEKAGCVVWPVQGHPHPNSPGEQLLAERIETAESLRGLFEYNIKIETVHGRTFSVDLVWRAGRVIVEVDGYHWHSSSTAFSNDRYRDYELLISGYLVLRLPHSEVLQDVEMAVSKIQDVVNFRRHDRSAK
jgi:very-short-patch-repair endonuclease